MMSHNVALTVRAVCSGNGSIEDLDKLLTGGGGLDAEDGPTEGDGLEGAVTTETTEIRPKATEKSNVNVYSAASLPVHLVRKHTYTHLHIYTVVNKVMKRR